MSTDDYAHLSTLSRMAACVMRQCVFVSIIDDDLFEDDEQFSVVLSEGPELDSRIILTTNITSIIIIDEDKGQQLVSLYMPLNTNIMSYF